jgi:NTE family protein
MGSVIGGLYATGYNAAQIDSIFQSTNFLMTQLTISSQDLLNFYERNNELYACFTV